MGDLAHPDTVALAADMLVSALDERGLPAERLGGSIVWATSRAGAAGRRQAVQCRMDPVRRCLGWFWVSHESDSVPSAPFALASQVELAADMIGVELAVRPVPRPRAVS